MKTRFQRLSFAVGLSLIIGEAAGRITEKETCIKTWDDYPEDRVGFNCKHYIPSYKHQIKTTSFSTPNQQLQLHLPFLDYAL